MAARKENKTPLDKTISPKEFEKYLYTSPLPPVDLLIRTAGEQRVSNFLLWQIAYAELYFATKYWPDFDKDDLDLAIEDFKKRKRNFGYAREQKVE